MIGGGEWKEGERERDRQIDREEKESEEGVAVGVKEAGEQGEGLRDREMRAR